MADLATVPDVEALWRPLTGDESVRVAGLLRMASAIVRRQLPTLDARISAATLDPDLARSVVATMVVRAMKNPDGIVARTVEDYSERYADAKAGLVLLPDEFALLAPRGTSRASSVPLRAYR
jgi:hypothetical protein